MVVIDNHQILADVAHMVRVTFWLLIGQIILSVGCITFLGVQIWRGRRMAREVAAMADEVRRLREE
jgi:hypothetical protein